MSNPPSSIYINPKFRNAHINPNFLPKNLVQSTAAATGPHNEPQQQQPPPPPPLLKPTNIFVNPNFLRPNQMTAVLTDAPSSTPAVPVPVTSQPCYRQPQQQPQYVQAKIISQTNRKLVRQPQQQLTQSSIVTRPLVPANSPLLRIGMRKLVRRNCSATAAASASSPSRSSSLQPPVRHTVALKAKHAATRYKFDRRPPMRSGAAAVGLPMQTVGGALMARTRHRLQRLYVFSG